MVSNYWGSGEKWFGLQKCWRWYRICGIHVVIHSWGKEENSTQREQKGLIFRRWKLVWFERLVSFTKPARSARSVPYRFQISVLLLYTYHNNFYYRQEKFARTLTSRLLFFFLKKTSVVWVFLNDKILNSFHLYPLICICSEGEDHGAVLDIVTFFLSLFSSPSCYSDIS